MKCSNLTACVGGGFFARSSSGGAAKGIAPKETERSSFIGLCLPSRSSKNIYGVANPWLSFYITPGAKPRCSTSTSE